MTAVNPLSRPEHWVHHRRPQNEAEVEEYQAWTFSAHPSLELALIVRDRFPDLFGNVASDWKSTLDDYARRRALAVGVGRNPAAEVGLELNVDELERAAEMVRAADPGELRRVYDAGRKTFREAVRSGRYAFAEWLEWRDACQAALKRAWATHEAGRVLGVVRGNPPEGPLPGGFIHEITAEVG